MIVHMVCGYAGKCDCQFTLHLYICVRVPVCLCMSKYMCYTCVCVSTDASVSGLEPGWVCLYESRQCACAGE